MPTLRRLLRLLAGGVGMWLLRRYRGLSLDVIKIRGAIWYLRGVQAARMAFVSGIGLAACLCVGTAGFVMFHIGLFLLLPAPYNAVALLALGALYALAALLVVRWACSEKTWMRLTRAGQIAEIAAKGHRP